MPILSATMTSIKCSVAAAPKPEYPADASTGSCRILRLRLTEPENHPQILQRSHNLGYFSGELEKDNEAFFQSAVEEFQCDHDLTVDGDCGPNTQVELEEVYGY